MAFPGVLMILALIQIVIIGSCTAFISLQPSRAFTLKGRYTLAPKTSAPVVDNAVAPPILIQRQRRSIADVQLRGLFGLGAPELAIILVAAVVLVGPQKISEFAKDSGKLVSQIPEELKQIPEEFRKGVEEGETDFRARNAKPMKKILKEIEISDEGMEADNESSD